MDRAAELTYLILAWLFYSALEAFFDKRGGWRFLFCLVGMVLTLLALYFLAPYLVDD